MTRLEKIREMTAEELADWWYGHVDCSDCPIGCFRGCECEKNVIDYLNAEAEPEPEVCSSCAVDF